ncbi:MAG TPA: flavodoxin [Dokdonella sp.]|nr:flavodoxin [Dokdonella sp.]
MNAPRWPSAMPGPGSGRPVGARRVNAHAVRPPARQARIAAARRLAATPSAGNPAIARMPSARGYARRLVRPVDQRAGRIFPATLGIHASMDDVVARIDVHQEAGARFLQSSMQGRRSISRPSRRMNHRMRAESPILIAFYSRSGVTRQVAQALAQALHADLLPIRDVRSREGTIGYVRSALEATHGTLPEIAACGRDPREYDLVVLGTPVWAGHMASPMRTFLHRYGAGLQRVAAFCTMSESGADGAFGDIRALTGTELEGTCSFTDRQVFGNEHLAAIAAFASELEGRTAPTPPRPAAPDGRHAAM